MNQEEKKKILRKLCEAYEGEITSWDATCEGNQGCIVAVFDDEEDFDAFLDHVMEGVKLSEHGISLDRIDQWGIVYCVKHFAIVFSTCYIHSQLTEEEQRNLRIRGGFAGFFKLADFHED